MRYIYLLLLMLPLSLLAKDSTRVSNGKWALGINASPDYCYRALKSDNSTSGNYIVASRNAYDLPQYGFTAGVQACYAFSKHFSFEFGINYMNKGDKTKFYGNFIFPSGVVDSTAPVKVSYQYRFHCVGIPLSVNYTTGANRLKLIATLGVVPYYLAALRNTETDVFIDNSEKTFSFNAYKSSGLSRINITAFASAGIQTQLSNHFLLRLQPIFRINTDVFDTNTSIKEHLWAAGLNVGVYYKL